MAVGVVYAGMQDGQADISLMGALAMSIGIAIQNIPEASNGTHSNLSTIGFALGFVLMMVLDVVIG